MEVKQSFRQYLQIECQYAALTVRAYLTDVQGLASFLVNQPDAKDLYDATHLPHISYRMLRTWSGDLMKKKLKPASITRKIAAIRCYFDFAKKSGWITQNPVARLQRPQQSEKLPTFLKQSETENLFENFAFPQDFNGIRDRCLLEILYGCGVRRAELLALQWADIDLSQNILRVTGKGNKQRLIPFGKHVAQSIEAYRTKIIAHSCNPAGVFFVNKRGKALSKDGVYHITKNHLMQVSHIAHHGPHVFRHTYATHLLDAGADLNDIKTLLGHSSLASTQIYTHNSFSKLKQVHDLAHPRAKMKQILDKE